MNSELKTLSLTNLWDIQTQMLSWIYESGAGGVDLYITSIQMVTRNIEVAATDQQERM